MWLLVASGFYPGGKREFQARRQNLLRLQIWNLGLVVSRGHQLFEFYHNAKKVR